MTDRDPTKRIPKSLGTDAKLFGRYTLTDLAVALFPGVVIVLLAQTMVPASLTVGGYSAQTLAIPLALVGIFLGTIFVYLTPAYTTSLEWFGTFLSFTRASKSLPHDETERYTQIERVYPERGAIERTDGALFGMVRVVPPSMALATEEEWARKAASFQDFCNTAVEFPIQIYSTTQPFPVDAYLEQYRNRLTDPDVKANPQLHRLIEEYLAWYVRDLEERRMTIRDHYVVVPVSRTEVQFEYESIAEKLARLPLVGLLIQAWFAPPIEVQRDAMFDALEERLRRVQAGLREVEGCDAQRIEAEDAARLIGEFWAGEPLEYGDMRSVLRTRPLIGGVHDTR